VKGWTDTHLASAYHFFFQSGFFECLPASTSASACEISSRDCGSGQDPWTGARFSSCFLPDFFDGFFFGHRRLPAQTLGGSGPIALARTNTGGGKPIALESAPPWHCQDLSLYWRAIAHKRLRASGPSNLDLRQDGASHL
jgi:hypothetical protein